MGKELDQPMVVENKAGAAGNIAAQYVANAAPDGRTLLVSYTSFSINASLYKKLPFDPLRDFTPISLLATVPSVLAVRSDFPANSMADLIALARSKPGQLSAGLGGLGSSLHLSTEMLKMMAGIDLILVPFQGSAPSMNALLGGQISMMFASTQNVASHVKAGTVKVLGVTSAQPVRSLPGVPPIADTVKGFESYSWYGLFGPARLPARTVASYNAAVRKVASLPEFRQLLEADSGEAKSGTPEEFEAFVRKDIDKYTAVVKATGASVN
jgi:tripartite-type tricarboxylate transporter receptor subunit TctC